MPKIQFDAKMIHDPSKASTDMFYRFDPPCYFDVLEPVMEKEGDPILDEKGEPVLDENGEPALYKGTKQKLDEKGNPVEKTVKTYNLDIPKEDRVWLWKKHLTSSELIKVNTKTDRRSPYESTLPFDEVWEMTVMEVHGFNGDLKPSDIINAVDSQQAQSLLVMNYKDSMDSSKLTEDERKN